MIETEARASLHRGANGAASRIRSLGICHDTGEAETIWRREPVAHFATDARKENSRGGVLTAGRDEAVSSAWRTPLRPKPRTFSFDHVLGADAKQESVFNCVAPLIDCVATGDRNATILASGATGCGKTHTILGTARAPGELPRAVKRMFHVLRATTKQGQEGQTGTYTVSLSYVELYRNRFVDLLAPPGPAFAGTAFGCSHRESRRDHLLVIDWRPKSRGFISVDPHPSLSCHISR